MYVYIQSESNLWTVGYYDNNNEWHPESDHNVQEEAAQRVAYLNGNCSKKINELQEQIDELETRLTNVMINAGVSDF